MSSVALSTVVYLSNVELMLVLMYRMFLVPGFIFTGHGVVLVPLLVATKLR